MKYENADSIFPEKLLIEIRQYVPEGYVYISPQSSRKEWGSVSGQREELEKRNNEIYKEYHAGKSVDTICLGIYLSVFQALNDKQDILRLFLIMLILSHVASTTLMYVLICKNAIIGAIITFMKFTLVEAAFNQMSKNIFAENINEILDKMCIFIHIINLLSDIVI